MPRTIRRASVLVATMAALGLTIAAPASASEVGVQATVGTAHSLPNFLGASGTLTDVNAGDCKDIPNMAVATSAQNISATKTIFFYAVPGNCTPGTEVAILGPGADISSGLAATTYTTD